MNDVVDRVNDGLRELAQVVELARFSSSCCDKPGDRMYRASDGTWWRRDGMDPRWVSAEAPEGWIKK